MLSGILTFLLLTAGCNTMNYSTQYTSISHINQKIYSHAKHLPDYDSPYTICYQNTDKTYSMYLFSAPVQYWTEQGYRLIDNELVSASKKGYAYENKANSIKTYFPASLQQSFRIEREKDYLKFYILENENKFSNAQRMKYTNQYGDIVSAVYYSGNTKDIVLYPTRAGIKTEIILKTAVETISFSIKFSGTCYENKHNGYLLLKDNNGIVGLIQQPLVQYQEGGKKKLDLKTEINVEKEGDTYRVDMTLGNSLWSDGNEESSVTLDPSFELYLNKIPDSSVYSNYTVNSYLRSYAVIGEHSMLGQGKEYVRFRLNSLLMMPKENLISAEYYVRMLSFQEPEDIYMERVGEQWSSQNIIWQSRPVTKEEIARVDESKTNDCRFDISEFVRNCFDDPTWSTESYGVVISSGRMAQSCILATADNALYPPYTVLTLSKLPNYFEPHENINPIKKGKI